MYTKLASVLILASGLTANAEIIYSNFEPDAPVNSGGGVAVYQPSWLAVAFQVSQTARLDQINAAFYAWGNPGQDLQVTLRTPGATPNGTILEAWTLTSASVNQPSSPLLLSNLNPLLLAGETYWLRAESTASSLDNRYGWAPSSTPGGFYISQDGGGTWFENSLPVRALHVEGTAVPTPEPSAILLLSAATLLTWRGSRKSS